MQLSHITLVVAAAAVTSANKNPRLGDRYNDHSCKVLHSLPNREFHINECIELETVGSLNLEFPGYCYLYVGHQCKGAEVAEFTTYDGAGTVSSWRGSGQCYDLRQQYWPKGKSLICVYTN